MATENEFADQSCVTRMMSRTPDTGVRDRNRTTDQTIFSCRTRLGLIAENTPMQARGTTIRVRSR